MEHQEYMNKQSNLSERKGVVKPSSVNDEAVRRLIAKKPKRLSVDEYVDGILAGNIVVLSQAITMVESVLAEHQQMAQRIIERCLPYTCNSIRIGITGVPGAGKSTFIEAFGKYLTARGKKLAVLAIDPSSQRTKGSILGDKTRMEELGTDPNAFIRPSPSEGSLGGVARKTRESVILCEAAGFDVIFIETVGVGQSEIAVHSMVDFFLLLMISGAGDELQGIKRGIMEMSDAIAINKCDGDNVKRAELARVQYQNALHLFPPPESGWLPKVETCSSIEKSGLDEIWKLINDYITFTKANGYFEQKRSEQGKTMMIETIERQLLSNFYENATIKQELERYENDVLSRKISPFIAATKLLDDYMNKKSI